MNVVKLLRAVNGYHARKYSKLIQMFEDIGIVDPVTIGSLRNTRGVHSKLF